MEKMIHQLEHLLQEAQNPKLLWEEMQIVSKKAFDLQDKIMAELERIEKNEQDIERVQALFDLRENVWDIMTQIATRELAVKEKTHHPKSPSRHEAGCMCHNPENSKKTEHSACCHHCHEKEKPSCQKK